jgi:hypothetical protein
MKLQIKDGVATPVNPYTEKEARKAFVKKYPKYNVYMEDGETPFPNTKAIDLSDFKKVYKAGLQKSILVFKSNEDNQVRKIVIKISDSDEPGKIDVDTSINNNLTIKDALVSLQKSYQEYSEILQNFFGLDNHKELIDFLNDNDAACDFLVREVLNQEG